MMTTPLIYKKEPRTKRFCHSSIHYSWSIASFNTRRHKLKLSQLFKKTPPIFVRLYLSICPSKPTLQHERQITWDDSWTGLFLSVYDVILSLSQINYLLSGSYSKSIKKQIYYFLCLLYALLALHLNQQDQQHKKSRHLLLFHDRNI